MTAFMHRLKTVFSADTADWVLRVASVAAIVSVAFLANTLHKQQHCFEKYVEAAAISTQARAAAAEQDRQSQDRLFQDVAAHPDTAFNYIQDYNLARVITDQQRADNPVPAAPSQACKN
jgi:hypothetical protein